MDLKFINEELVRLHNALSVSANQDVPLAKWAMERITAIHEILLTPNYIYRDNNSGINFIANPDTETSTVGWATYTDNIRSGIKAADVIEGTWMDSTGLIWYPAIKGIYTYEEALAKAKELGLRLPTIEEFKQAEKEGIRTKFNDFKDCWFWSSSPHPSSAVFALFFDGNSGRVYDDVRDGGGYVSVRCVGRGIKYNL